MPEPVWKIIREYLPPTKKPFWGAELFYGGVFLCEWDGKNTCDDGSPFCWKVDNEHDDDIYIFAWAPVARPKFPNKVARDYQDKHNDH